MEDYIDFDEFYSNIKDKSNVEITDALDVLSNEFNLVKNEVISLTHKLDSIEEMYGKLLKEYNSRNNYG